MILLGHPHSFLLSEANDKNNWPEHCIFLTSRPVLEQILKNKAPTQHTAVVDCVVDIILMVGVYSDISPQ